MPIAPRVSSLAEVALHSDGPTNFSLALRDFVDGFYEDPAAEKLTDEPADLSCVLADDGYANAYLAATAEYLANRYHLTIPRWSQQPSRVLANPVFAMKTYEG